VGLVAVFEGMDEIPAVPFIKQGSPGNIKAGLGRKATTALVIRPRPEEGHSADRAERMPHWRHLFQAGGADVERSGIRDETSADMAERRKEEIEEGGQKWVHVRFTCKEA
jgi:hypothetical protein